MDDRSCFLVRRGAAVAALAAVLAIQLAAPNSVLAGRCDACDDDRDGYSDADELFILGTDPLDANSLPRSSGHYDGPVLDSDGDSIGDGDQLFVYGTNPHAFDTDGDGRSDWDELFVDGTSPFLVDTDGDGVDDFAEGLVGTNPLDPASR